MRLRSFLSLILPAMAVVAAACAPATPPAAIPTLLDLTTPEATPIPAIPTAAVVPAATATVQPAAPSHSFTPATYQVPSEGIELDYPSDWTTLPVETVGSRGSQGQLFSPGSSAETLADGGTRMAMTVYLWDPKNDLAAYVTQRKTAWESSGFTLAKDAGGDLTDGRKYASFIIQTPDNHQAFFLFTTLGDKYLEISGEGNLALVEEIALTVRPIK